MEGRYNLRSPAVKRLMREAQELAEPTEQYYAQPLEDNLFEWHFTIRGPDDSDFSGGIYHGRIILPPDYPMKPPSIVFLTPNGRFDCHTKICLSISKHHPESWQPSWSIRTALLAIIGFMPSPGHGAIGSLDYTSGERVKLSRRSTSFVCEVCGPTSGKVLALTDKSKKTQEEIAALAAQLSMAGEKPTASGEKVKLPDAQSQADTGDHATVVPEKESSALPPESVVEPPASVTTQRNTNTSNATSNEPSATSNEAGPVNNNQTSSRNSLRSENAAEPVRSRSCLDNVTLWALVIIGVLMGALIFRRLAKFNYPWNSEEL
ncbi:ubiquitin-conjugating enzyme E2 J1-like [Watersipora subatra]|uniref:ubiquitin-conjugating enzyme E2 J1-like n=1 Tax=Watersipora subatra TaxID=2589382 RepID=UPI00355AF52D